MHAVTKFLLVPFVALLLGIPIAQAQNILILTTGNTNTIYNNKIDAENNYMPTMVQEFSSPLLFNAFTSAGVPCNNTKLSTTDASTGLTKTITCNQTELVDGHAMESTIFDPGYDLLVIASAYTQIDPADWAAIENAVSTRKVRGAVFFVDTINPVNTTNMEGLFSRAMNSSPITQSSQAGSGNFYYSLNSNSAAAPWFSELSTLNLNSSFYVYKNVPTAYALYGGVDVPASNPAIALTGTTTNATGIFIPQANAYSGAGSCIFGVTDIGWGGPAGTTHNFGKLGNSFLQAFNDTTSNAICAAAVAAPPVIAVTKSTTANTNAHPTQASTIPYTVLVTNTSPAALALNVGVTDAEPAGLSLGQWSCTQVAPIAPTGLCPMGLTTGSLAATISSLPAGGQLQFSTVATVNDASQTLTNTATLTLPPGATCDGGADPCTSTVTFAAPLPPTISIGKTTTADTSAVPAVGSTVPFTVEVTNMSTTSSAANVGVTDSQPAGMTLGQWSCTQIAPASPANLCPAGLPVGSLATTVASLPAGAKLQFTVNAKITDNTQALINIASLNLPTGVTCNGGADPCESRVSLPSNRTVAVVATPVPTLSPLGLMVLTALFGVAALHTRRLLSRRDRV